MSAAIPGESRVPEAIPHRRDIDGLRSIAVLAVVGYHCKFLGVGGGFVGVDVFFAISGYLICSLILRDLDRGRFSIARFYERRCKRILPALFAVLLFCIVASLLIASPYEASTVGKGIMGSSVSISNVLFYREGNYFYSGGTLNPLLMTWSLAVEEQFYLCFPLIMLLLYKRSKKHLFAILAALCIASLLLSIRMEFTHPEFNFYLPFTRAWELGAGALLAFYEARRPAVWRRCQWHQDFLSWLGLALILGSVILYTPAVRFPGYEAIPPVLGAVLILATRNGGANRLLSLPPFVAIGLISYSLYLWHWPLLSFAAIISPVPITIINRLCLMILAFFAATLSFFLIEQPFRTRAAPHVGRILAAYAMGIACFALLGGALDVTGGLPQRAPTLARIERSIDLDRGHACFTMSEDKPNRKPECFPPESAVPVMALLGDSHAEALDAALRVYANFHGYHLLVLAMPSCPPLQGVTRYSDDAPQFASECAVFNRQALATVAARPDVKLVLLAGDWPMVVKDRFLPVDYRADPSTTTGEQHVTFLLQGLGAEVGALQSAGKQVILVDDIPSLPFDPLNHYRYEELPVRRLLVDLLGHPIRNTSATSVSRSEAINTAAEKARVGILSLAKSDPGLRVIDTKSIFCNQTQCSIFDGHDLYYSDNNHVSPFGADKIVSTIDTASDATKVIGSS
jgi:peptidoglycan/LPS O-acetylase OafA/YrhL